MSWFFHVSQRVLYSSYFEAMGRIIFSSVNLVNLTFEKMMITKNLLNQINKKSTVL